MGPVYSLYDNLAPHNIIYMNKAYSYSAKACILNGYRKLITITIIYTI